MTAADVDDVLSIELAVQAYPWSRGNFSDALNSGYLCYVLEAAGQVCGYAVLMPGVEEAELLNIGVAKAFQRQGAGGRMLSHMLLMAGAMALHRVFLEVRASNQSAIFLYRRAGFSEIGVRRAYYRSLDGCEDARVMACDVLIPSPPAGEGNKNGQA